MGLSSHNGNYKVPQIIFICSDSVCWASAVEKILRTLTDTTPHVIQSTNLDEIASMAESFSSNSLGCGDSTFLIRYDSVSADVVPMCINTVVGLRNRSYNWQEYSSRWSGAYIAIVENEILARKIETADLFGSEECFRICFSTIRGHKCLFKVAAISQIIKTIADIRKIGWREWDRIYYQKWCGGPLLTLRRKIVKLLKLENVAVYDICENVQKLCFKIDWSVFMPHKAREALVRSLLNRPIPKTIDEVRAFLQCLDEVLAEIIKIRHLKKE